MMIDRILPSRCQHPRSIRPAALRPAASVVAVLLMTVAVGGCQRFQPTPYLPPPPGMDTAAPAGAGSHGAGELEAEGGVSVATAPSTSSARSAARRPPLNSQPSEQSDNENPPAEKPTRTIVRGQGGGFAIPPISQLSADGGRHSREPLPVSGQPTAVVVQNPPQKTPAAGSTRTPAVAQSQYTSPPGYTPPIGTPPSYAAQPGYAQPGYAQQPGYAPQPSYSQVPGPAATPAPVPYNSQPGYQALPEIAGEDLAPGISIGEPLPYEPLTRTADIIVNGYPARTGRIMFGGAVNSDAGVTGQITIEERNFDITRFPRSFQDLIGGTAFRGAGQTFRVEAVPGSQFKRYSVSFSEPYLFGYLPISMSVSGFLFDRRYEDWDEERLGGRLSFGYRITPDLSISAAIRAENVEVSNPSVAGVPQLDEVLGDNDLYSGQLQLTHDTRNSPFAPSEGHYLELSYEQAFGDFEYPRGEIALSKYFLVRERADGSGQQVLTTGWSLGFSGEDTPIFENYFAGGYSTMRGFDFRGASPTENGVQVGGRFKFLGTVEYMFPLTADDMLRGVAFVDYGTIEQEIEINSDNFRVAPGVGLRVAVPALGPAPLAFDFAFPIEEAATDDKQTFSFYMGLNRRF